MRLKLASVLLLAGTVVGCAGSPPPPPPMPAPDPMPAPMPAPAMMGPMSGTYRGTAEVAGSGTGCRAPRGTQTARVRNNTITMASARGRIGADGMVTGRNISGTVTGGNADLTVTRGRCSYHYTLSNGSTTMGGSSSMAPMGGSSSVPVGGYGAGPSNAGSVSTP